MQGDFLVGDWVVRPHRGCMERGSSVVHLTPKTMAVLRCLAEAHGDVVSRQKLFDTVWPESVVTDDALTQRIVEIRKAFDDSAREPSVIETIPKVGFRLVAPVAEIGPSSIPGAGTSLTDRPRHAVIRASWRRIGAISSLIAALVGIWWVAGLNHGAGLTSLVEPQAGQARAGQAPERPETIAAAERSVAVLPFVSTGSQHDSQSLTDAMHEEVLTRLARIASLKVISKTSVEKYRGTDLPPSAIARELSVAAILTGSVQSAGNQVRVRVRLVDGRSEKHLWAASFDRDLTTKGLFAIQTEIAERVSQSLRASLTPEELARISEVPTESFEAYQALLEGHVDLKQGTPAAFERALAHFQRALELNPGFPQAYLAIAQAYFTMVEQGGVPEAQGTAKAEAYARTALRLDPNLGLAYAYLGHIRRESGHYDEAEALLRKALELEPGNSRVLHGMGLTLRLQGRALEAVPYYNRAAEIDPLSPLINESRGSLLRDLGRYEEAEKQYRRALTIDPNFVNTHWGLGTLYWSLGKPEQAVPWFENAVRLAPGGDVFRAWLALMHLELRKDDQARAVIDDALRIVPISADNDTVLAEELFRIYNGLDLSGLPDGRLFMFRHWHGSLVELPVRALLDGRYDVALEQYRRRIPQLFSGEPEIDGDSYRAAIYAAFALNQLGMRQQATALLDQVESFLAGKQRLGIHGYWVADVQILAVRGDYAGSLQRLKAAVHEGWRNLWRFYLLHDPILQVLRTQPGYDALVISVENDMETSG